MVPFGFVAMMAMMERWTPWSVCGHFCIGNGELMDIERKTTRKQEPSLLWEVCSNKFIDSMLLRNCEPRNEL